MNNDRYMVCVWRNGQIDIHNGRKPAGVIVAARFMSRRAALVGNRAVQAIARHAHDGETLLVPGIPEAVEDTDALDALRQWSHRLDDRLRRLLPAGSYKVEGIAA